MKFKPGDAVTHKLFPGVFTVESVTPSDAPLLPAYYTLRDERGDLLQRCPEGNLEAAT